MAAQDVGAELASDAVLRALGVATDLPMIVVRPTSLGGEPDGELLWVSDVATRILGAAAGQTVRGAFGLRADSFPAAEAGRTAFARPGSDVHFGPVEWVLDGQERTFSGTARAAGDLLVLTYHDITAEVRAEERAARTQSEFQEVLDGLDAAVVLLQPVLEGDRVVDAEIVWSNQRSRVLWIDHEGLRPGTRVAAKYYDAADWLRGATEAWGGASHTRILTPNPTRARWSAATETLQRIGDLILEMTVDRSGDTELLDRLNEADLRFEALVADLPSSVFVGRWGVDELDFVSPNAAELLGVPASGVQRISDVLSHVDSRQQPTDQTVLGWLAGEAPDFESDWHVTRGDGTRIICALRAVRRTTPSGEQGFIALVSDVTEQRRLLAEVAADERMRSLGRAAGSIAHDFNNLLMIVGGNIDRVIRRGEGDTAPLEAAATATRRATQLAQSMLAFARARPGDPTDIDVADLMRRLEPMIRATLPSRATITVDTDTDLPSVQADAAHLEQVVLNLVTNAREAIEPTGSVTIGVRRSPVARCHLRDEHRPGDWIEVRVADDGAGVPSDLLGRIWEPYVTVKNHSNDSGAGLGLSTVHGLVHQYGGHAVLDSTPGAGTVVYVYLPAGLVDHRLR